MDRYEWTNEHGAALEVRGNGTINGSGPGAPHFDSDWIDALADEILRLATRLKEAEELLREVEKFGDKRERDCPFCGLWFGVHAVTGDGCRLGRFLSEQSSAPPG
jgi:hypothetical protein